MIARVVVENAAYSFDIPFSYQVPQQMQPDIRPGCRVLAPFGKANRAKQGLVLALEEGGEQENLKPLKTLLDYQPLLDSEQLWLLELLHRRTFCTYYEALRALVPSGLTVKVRVMCSLGEKANLQELQQPLQELQQKVLDYLREKNKPVATEKLLMDLGIAQNAPAFQELIRQGLVVLSEDVREKSADSKMIMVRLSDDCQQRVQAGGVRMTAVRKKVLEILSQTPSASLKELCYYAGTTRQTLNKMEKEGLLTYYGRQIYRPPYAERREEAPEGTPSDVQLSPSQQQAFDSLWQLCSEGKGGEQALLYGVTGSGKSQVYLKLAERVREQGRGVIILVPEISLTPQTVELFGRRFGKHVAVLHSGLTMAERADEYKRIKQGLADVVVGTRSAVFAPVKKIGLIVIDEEQEGAYASQQAPRYHAREIARLRCRRHGALLLMASATPSVETFYQAKRGKIHLFTLSRRYLGSQLPKVQIVDMKQSFGFDISQELTAELADNLQAGQQSIVLLNRRGYHTAVRCNQCGEVLKCPNCSVALTYHSANHRLMCHYCGYSRPLDQSCPNCGSNLINCTGSGTQRIEDELHRIFPQASILRMDMDTTMSRMAHETKFNDFAQGKYQIMVGTQMVAKGLNFPEVTLVGVLNADQSIFSQDFRGCERAFSLLTQVVGRCGRGKLPGRALIQTYSPDHPVILQAAKQDYDRFFADEIKSRKLGLYPPFCTLCQVGFSGENEDFVRASAQWFAARFREKAAKEYPELPLRMMNPCEMAIARVAGKYRYGLIIKCRMSDRFCELMWGMLRAFDSERKNKGVHVWVDLNASDL